MGLRDWLAKNIAGAGAYGDTMGRSTAENGLALGRMLYLGHGIRTGPANCYVFEDAESMASKGYLLYSPDPTKKRPAEDSSKLSVLTRAAGVAFGAYVAMNAAHCFRSEENQVKFRRSLGASNAKYVQENSPDVPMESVTRLMKLEMPRTVTQALDLKSPGTGDLFGVYLMEICRQHQQGSVGFQRRGVLGFDTWAVTLAEQTVLSIQKAAGEYGF